MVSIMGHGWLEISLILVTISSDFGSQAISVIEIFDNAKSFTGINGTCKGNYSNEFLRLFLNFEDVW